MRVEGRSAVCRAPSVRAGNVSFCCSITRRRLGVTQGFVRIAVKTGASLVPVLSFGENNIFQVSKPKEKSAMALVQK